MIGRRLFLRDALVGGLALGQLGCVGPVRPAPEAAAAPPFRPLVESLLRDWCEGLLRVQIDRPEDPTLHGALGCPACDKIHGRCMDAVYPFLYLADTTGDERFLRAGIAVLEWAERNVSRPDGSWTVIPDPKSWRGITVFGAIALAEAIHHHGHLLDARWTDRLARAADYVYRNFDLTFTNINYGFTAIHALHLFGEVLDRPDYTARSHELAQGIPDWLTTPHRLLFGEAKPSDLRSPRGHYGVDLGYNVEESLNGVVLYALRAGDTDLLDLLEQSLAGHLEFMLPDGGWDNSWGTRQYKWSYWGSRTTDGCQPAYAFLAGRRPAFATAAYRSTELLRRCTADGLLHGGPHFVSHGVPPCVHHTFAHAKPLAALLDAGDRLPEITPAAPLPRARAVGARHFPEIDVWLAARGPWRATVSAYDFIYRADAQQATGGALALLYHGRIGPVFAASMADYVLVEKNNQQPNPPGDNVLTPRLQLQRDGQWYTNLYDLTAQITTREAGDASELSARVTLRDADRATPPDAAEFQLDYRLDPEEFVIEARRAGAPGQPFGDAELVLPVISPTGEAVTRISERHWEIAKPAGRLVVRANVPLHAPLPPDRRLFNQVPGFEAVPVVLRPPAEYTGTLRCTLSLR